MRSRSTVTLAVVVALVAAIALSLAIGARSIPLGTVWETLTDAGAASADHLVVRELRVSRTLIGLLAGAALAVAGALMQSLTRNPFADPGLLGINSGASLAVVIAGAAGVATTFAAQVPLAFAGAALAAVVVYAMGARGSAAGAPLRLALAGVALTALVTSATYAILMLDKSTLDQYRQWVAGSLTSRRASDVAVLGALVIASLAAAFAATRTLEAMTLGDDSARALGVRTGLARAGVVAIVTLLSASATAAAGPIAFVGLAVPHLMRALAGASLRWLLVLCALGGGALTLACDVVGRVIAPPSEIGVGVTTAFIGGLLFAIAARRMRAVDP